MHSQVAEKWAKLGLKIVPVKIGLDSNGKKTVTCLWRWQQDPYPGFENLNWSGANSFGVVLGETQVGWLACVDCDHDAGFDAYTILTKAFPGLSTTYIERTPNGFHFFIFIDKPADATNINIKTKNGLELHVNGLIFMAPSSYEGSKYEVYNQTDILREPGFYQKFQKTFDLPEKGKIATELKNTLIEGERNETLTSFAGTLRRRGLTVEEIYQQLLILNQSRCTPPLSNSEVESIAKSMNRYRPEENLTPKTKPVTTNEEIAKSTPWPEIPDPIPYESEEKLEQELMAYLLWRLEMSYQEQYATIVAAIKHSWLIDLSATTPYLFFYGPKRSGKTRALDLLEQLCYKAIFVGNTSRAGIYWMMENYHPTLLLDETETYTGKDENAQDIQRLLNIGYRRGPRVYRLEKNTHGKQQLISYDTFGFKALAGTRFLSNTLEDRCIVFKMVKNARPMKPIDYELARELRGKLHQWQLDIFDVVDVNKNTYRVLRKLTNIDALKDERLKELFYPLLRASAHCQGCQQRQMVSTLASKTQEIWDEDLKLSLDAEILEKIKEAPKIENRFATCDVTDLFNATREEDSQFETRSVGYIIRRLGFEHTRMQDGKRGWLWDEGLYKRRTYQFKLALNPHAQLDDNFGTVVPRMRKYDWEEG